MEGFFGLIGFIGFIIGIIIISVFLLMAGRVKEIMKILYRIEELLIRANKLAVLDPNEKAHINAVSKKIEEEQNREPYIPKPMPKWVKWSIAIGVCLMVIFAGLSLLLR